MTCKLIGSSKDETWTNNNSTKTTHTVTVTKKLISKNKEVCFIVTLDRVMFAYF